MHVEVDASAEETAPSFLFLAKPAPRLIFFFLAVAVKLTAFALSAAGFVQTTSQIWVSGFVVWVLWFAMMFGVAAPRTDKLLKGHTSWLKPLAITFIVIILVVGLGEAVVINRPSLVIPLLESTTGNAEQIFDSLGRMYGYNDATALTHQATDNFIAGDNPYATANIITALNRFGGDGMKTTPLREGRFADAFPYPTIEQLEALWNDVSGQPENIPPEVESKLCYPAGSFLFTAPFIFLGIPDVRWIYLLYAVIGVGFVVWYAPRNTRLVLSLAFLVSLDIWNGIFSGETGSLVFPFLLVAWILPRKYLWLSAILMGIAVGTKQTAWFFIPFYLIVVFRTLGFRQLARTSLIIFGVFVVLNLPFFVQDPRLWVISLLAPMTDRMFPLGGGIITFVIGGALNVRSSLPFTVIELVAIVGCAVWYYRNCRRYPYVGPVLSVLPLYFAWRSLWPYFFYVDVILFTAIVLSMYAKESRRPFWTANLPASGAMLAPENDARQTDAEVPG
jgi:hypothetical protein